MIVKSDAYMPKFYDECEQLLLPLFEFISDPSKIDFDDDILLTIKTLVSKKKGVTETIWRMVPCLHKVQQKNNGSLGCSPLMETLNVILMEGRQVMGPIKLEVFVNMARTAIESDKGGEEKCEGILLLQLILQTFEGSPVLN